MEEVTTGFAEEDDLDLIRRVAAQDRQAFEALYRRYAPRLHGYLWKLLRRREVVEEVLDDVMVVIWKGSTKFNFTSRLSTWIFGIAHNMALKAFRKYPREPAGLSPEQEEPIDEGAADAPVLRDELRAAVARALQTLPPEQRAVVELTFYHGHSYQEIAAIVGSPVNTIKTRMFYARQRLAPIFVKLGISHTQ